MREKGEHEESEKAGVEIFLELLGAVLDGSMACFEGGFRDWIRGVAVVTMFVAVMAGLIALLSWMLG